MSKNTMLQLSGELTLELTKTFTIFLISSICNQYLKKSTKDVTEQFLQETRYIKNRYFNCI